MLKKAKILLSAIVISLIVFSTISTSLMSVVGKAQADNTSAPLDTVEFPIPAGTNSNPQSITKGPDGNVWFTEYVSSGYQTDIGKISPDGEINLYLIPTVHSYANNLTAGPDGNVWFTESGGNKIGKVTTNGEITEYSIPTPNSNPNGITAGPDGNIWFTEFNTSKIGRVTPDGDVKDYSIPTNCSDQAGCEPTSIAAGPDGNLWFTEINDNADRIGKVTTDGHFTEYPSIVPQDSPSYPPGATAPYTIIAGSDGNLWFTEPRHCTIGKITTSGEVTEYTLYPSCVWADGIIKGQDGNIWFTGGAGKIASITSDGKVSWYDLSISNSWPVPITTGADGNIWFTDFRNNAIGRITSPVSPTSTPTPTPTVTPTEIPTLTPTNMPTPTPTITPTPTSTADNTVINCNSVLVSDCLTPTITPTETPGFSNGGTTEIGEVATPTPSPTEAPTDTPNPTPTQTPEPTSTPTPTETPELSQVITQNVTDTPMPTPTVTISPTPQPTDAPLNEEEGSLAQAINTVISNAPSSPSSDSAPWCGKSFVQCPNAGPLTQGIQMITSGSGNSSDGNLYIEPLAGSMDLVVRIAKSYPFSLSSSNGAVPVPWQQGLNTAGEIFSFSAISAFNGFPVTTLDHPAIIMMHYDPTRLFGHSIKDLRIAWYNEETKKWEVLEKNTVIKPNENLIANTTIHMGYFVVVYPKK